MLSVMETHLKWVEKLKEQGQVVLPPEHSEPMNSIQGYIKTQIPHKDAGAIFQDANGTFGLFIDMGCKIVDGITWDDLGLCDSRCWYEWMDSRNESKSKSKELTKESAESLIKSMKLNLEKIEDIKQNILNTIHYLDQFR